MKKKTTEQKQYDRIDKIFTDARESTQNRLERVQEKRAEVEAIVEGIEEQRRMKWNLIAYALVFLTACAVVVAALTVWG
jgi:Flp pilus assembly protein TadB